jgi:hypothetical protein
VTDQLPGPDARDELDERLTELLVDRSGGTPGQGLEARIVSRARETRQRRRRALVPAWWSGAWPGVNLFPRAATLASVGLAVVLGSVLLGTLGTTTRPSSPGATGALGSSPVATVATPVATDLPPSSAPHVPGTCPVTPLTGLVGGITPEIDVSGLRWRWGDTLLVAGVDQKVTWLADSTDAPVPGIAVLATELDLPILVGGQPFVSADAAGAPYVALVDSSSQGLLHIPRPGCWLLTATWSAGASSVVVAMVPAPGAASPAPATPDPIVASQPLAACPATAPSTSPVPQGWPGPAISDGPFRWLLPPNATWILGGTGDKLVLDSEVGWAIGEMRIVAMPLARAAKVGRLRATVVSGDLPPLFGGGTLGFGVTLPNRDCWAFVFLDPATTSTIVADLRR